MIDRYSKIVLTVIAGALVTIAIQNFMQRAYAQMECGAAPNMACYVQTGPFSPLNVRVER